MATGYQPFRTPWAVGLANQFNLRTLPQHADQVLIAGGIYQALFIGVSPALSKAIIPNIYDKFDDRTRTNWNSRVVGFVQAVFICGKALQVITSDPSRHTATVQERLWGYSPALGEVQAYAAGYFLWDIYVSARHQDLFGPTSLAHAVCAFLVTMVGFVSKAMPYQRIKC